MKRFVLAALAVLLFPITATADARHRDMLLAEDGTLYTVATIPNLNTPASRFLQLTVQRRDVVNTYTVPSTDDGGDHTRPALAYDTDSKMVFVFWLHAPTPMATELLFASYHNGRFSKPTSIGGTGAFRFRNNLRVGVTRRLEQVNLETGETEIVPGLTVHAVWWEETGLSQAAHYAMLTIEKGNVTSVAMHPMVDFITHEPADIRGGIDGVNDILRHASIVESSNRLNVDVIFGDVTSNRIHRVTLKPFSDAGRVRIPIGVREVSHPAPGRFTANSTNARVTAVDGYEGDFAFYTVTEAALHYLVFQNGAWSPERSLILSDGVTAQEAVDVLRRRMATQ